MDHQLSLAAQKNDVTRDGEERDPEYLLRDDAGEWRLAEPGIVGSHHHGLKRKHLGHGSQRFGKKAIGIAMPERNVASVMDIAEMPR